MAHLEDKGALSFVVIRDAGVNIKMAKIHLLKSKRTLSSVDVPNGRTMSSGGLHDLLTL